MDSKEKENINEEELKAQDAQDETCEETTEKEEEVALTEEEKLTQELQKANAEIEDQKDKYLRLSAEFDNYRKRTMKEKAELILNGGEKSISSILPIVDDFTNPNVKGAQSFFYEKSEKSKKLGLILQNHLNKKINTEKEKAAKPNNSYYMLINSKCPGTIIECGFLSNPSEEKSLSKEEYQKKLAEIICTGIKEYFGEK